jgi:fatty-acyl-CoA synthase
MQGMLEDAVTWWGDRLPDTTAISVSGDAAITFRELEAWSARAADLISSRGVTAGDRVGVLGANSVGWCVAAVAIVRVGAILVPLNSRYTSDELRSIVADCGPKLIICDADRDQQVIEAAPDADRLEMRSVVDLRDGLALRFRGPREPDLVAVIGYTSGSTAAPKGVMFTHRSMWAYAIEAQLNYPAHRPGARAINVAPLYTGAGTIQLMHFLCLGVSDYLEPEFDGQRALDLIIRERVTLFGAVPTFWQRIAAAPGFAEADISHIEHATVGGARVPLELLETYRKKGVVLRQLYGLTEGGGTTSAMPADEALQAPERCGRGGIFTRHRIVDESGEDVPPGQPGEIVLNGPAMMKGYWNNPDATKAAFFGDWLRTGDIGSVDEKGNILYVDRLKDMIISGGLNIWPLDIEAVISEVEGVDEVAVIAAKDERFGETPMAIVYGRDVDPARIIAHCNLKLSNYKVPRYIAVETEPLPRLATGKLAKPLLRRRYANAHQELTRVR